MNQRLTELTELQAVQDGDFLYIVDVSDPTDGVQGTGKKITKFNMNLDTVPYLGSVSPSSTPTGTGKAYWFALEDGTYTNFGGVVVLPNSIAIISRDSANVYSISQNEISLTGYVKFTDVVNTLVSTETAKPLSANQGKVLKDLIDSKTNTPVIDGFASTSTTSAGSANNDRLLNENIALISQKTAQLLDKSLFVAGSYYSNSTGEITASASWKRTAFIQLEPSTQYTISGVRATFLGGLYNSSGVRQNKLNEPTGAFLTELTFTTGTTNNFLGLNISDSENTNPNGYDNTALLRLGTSKVYVPYGFKIPSSCSLLIITYFQSVSLYTKIPKYHQL